MNELETMLREQLRAADAVRVTVDPDAVLRAGRRARSARVAWWVAAAVALVALAAWFVAMSWRGLPGGDVDAVPDPLQTPSPTVTTTPSPTATTTPSSTPTPPATAAARVTLEAPGDTDGAGPDDRVVAELDGTATLFTWERGEPVRVAVPTAPGAGKAAVNPAAPQWVALAINGRATWVAPTERRSPQGWSADAEVFEGTGVTAAVIRYVDLTRWTPSDDFVWGGADGRVFVFDGATAATTRVPAVVFDSVRNGPATFAYDADADLWIRRYVDWGTQVAHPSEHPGGVPAALAGADDGKTFEVVAVLPRGVDAATVTWASGNGEPTGRLEVQQAADGGPVFVRQLFTKADPNNPEPSVRVTWTEAGKRVTKDIANW